MFTDNSAILENSFPDGTTQNRQVSDRLANNDNLFAIRI